MPFEDARLEQLLSEKHQYLSQEDAGVNTNGGKLNQDLLHEIFLLYYQQEDFSPDKMNDFSLEEIPHYLKLSHRYYLHKKLPEIEQSILHVLDKDPGSTNLYTSLVCFFNAYKNNLIEHIRLEEQELFPYIQSLFTGTINGGRFMTSDNNFTIQNFIQSHLPIEDELKKVSEIIHHWSKHSVLPLPYKIFLNQVEIFEVELRMHGIIEDAVLVPMAIELEKKGNFFTKKSD